MTTQTVARRELYQVIDALPEDRLVMALDFLRDLRNKQPSVGTSANDDGFYDAANIQWLKGSIAQMAQGRTVTKTFEDLEHMANE
jgi:hypothetical protein